MAAVVICPYQASQSGCSVFAKSAVGHWKLDHWGYHTKNAKSLQWKGVFSPNKVHFAQNSYAFIVKQKIRHVLYKFVVLYAEMRFLNK